MNAENTEMMDQHPCNAFTKSDHYLLGPYDKAVIDMLCGSCGWGRLTHHDWRATNYPSLGPGWVCRSCSRTAYAKDSRCSAEAPPVDYPPCWPSWLESDGDTD